MSKSVEMWGGPRDGELLALPDSVWDLKYYRAYEAELKRSKSDSNAVEHTVVDYRIVDFGLNDSRYPFKLVHPSYKPVLGGAL